LACQRSGALVAVDPGESRQRAAGGADESLRSTIDLGCMAAPLDACDFVDPNHERDHLVSDGLDALGGHVDRISDACRDGQIAFAPVSGEGRRARLPP
jgi:hypothetical protein